MTLVSLTQIYLLQVFVTRADWSRRALTQPEMMDAKQGGRFNTTEIHCTEYHSAVRKGKLELSLIAALTDLADSAEDHLDLCSKATTQNCQGTKRTTLRQARMHYS